MDFSIPKTTRDLLDRARRLVDETVVPLEATHLEGGFDDDAPALLAARQKVREAGLWAPQLPSDVGGLGLSNLDHGMLSEVLGQSPLGHYVFGCQAPDAGNMEILHRFGTPAQKAEFLAPLVDGKIRSCFSMTEPGHAGSNPTEMSCVAVRDGDEYVINGRKWFTTGADGAAFAIVMAVTNPDAPRHQRASQIIVPANTDGFNIVRNIPIMGHAGRGWLSHSEIEYRDCRVPVTNRLGEEGDGFAVAQDRLGPGRIHHCMRWIGICERSLSMMIERAASRQVSPTETLADKQMIQAWIAEARAEINASRLMVLQAAWKIDNLGFRDAREEISIIKFYVADVLMRTVDRAMQVHGALGITSDTVLAHYYMHERGARIYDGPDEVHKMVVAKRLLKPFRK